MGRIIDADSHFMEPLDLWQRYIEPKYRARALRFEPRPDSNRFMILTEENKRARFNVEDFLGVEPRCARIPQAQRSEPVAVDVFGGALQLGERRNRMPCLGGELVVDFQQDGFIALYDQRTVAHYCFLTCADRPQVPHR